MSEEEKDRRDLATNRLLDLLRAQQAGGEAGEGEKTASEAEAAGSEAPAPEQEVEAEAKESPTAEALLATLAKTRSLQEPAAEPGEAESPTAPTEKVRDDQQKLVAEQAPEPGTSELLEQIQATPFSRESEEEVEVEPEDFDSSLFSTLPERKQQLGFRDYVNAFFHIFDESQRRVTIHCGEQFLRFLQLRIGLKGTEIEKFSGYSLPLETGEKTITAMEELLPYVLEKELDVKQRKTAFGGFYGNRITTRTHILQTPKLKQKELSDLVEWNAKRNLPFGAEQAVVSWESMDAVGDSTKQNIVIGIGEKDPIEDAIASFSDHKLKLRLFSTLPVLLWKLFVRNYPERKEGCYVLVHIGETHTAIAVVVEQKLLFSREITVGAQDFYKAVAQKVVVGNTSIEIDYSKAKRLLADYGIPKNGTGVIPGSGISLYKISIFLRPVVERMTNELDRSLTYFKKQNPDLEWEELMFDGIGATFPHLLEVFNENLDLKVSLLNPLRTGKYVQQDGSIIPDRMLPDYAINLSLAAEESERINVLPKNVRANYRYIFLHKVAAVMAAFFIPFFITTTILSSKKAERLQLEVAQKSGQWDKLSAKSKEYFGLLSDMDILNGFRKFLDNDRIYSRNQIKILKLLSSTVTTDLKFTSLAFKKEVVKKEEANSSQEGEQYRDVLEIKGFVQADPSVADIHLTNFIMNLEELGVFSHVDTRLQEQSDSEDGKLFFTVNLRL